jgi:hypothetical protein
VCKISARDRYLSSLFVSLLQYWLCFGVVSINCLFFFFFVCLFCICIFYSIFFCLFLFESSLMFCSLQLIMFVFVCFFQTCILKVKNGCFEMVACKVQ